MLSPSNRESSKLREKMKECRKCGLPLKFEKRKGKWYPTNPDGSEHWDLCKEIRNRGKVFEEKSSGVIHGDLAKPNECDCGLPPWELCQPDCRWALNPSTEVLEYDAMQHLRQI